MNTTFVYYPPISTATRVFYDIPSRKVVCVKPDIIGAVEDHLYALRRLGKTKISSSDIAFALELPLADVKAAMLKLRSVGVKEI